MKWRREKRSETLAASNGVGSEEGGGRYRLLAENSTDVISVTDPAGVIRYVSPACRLQFGFAPHELVGRSGFDLVHPEDRERVAKFHAALLDGGDYLTAAPHRVRRKDGGFAWVEVTARAVRDPETGDVVEVQSSARDVSKRRDAESRLERSERQLAEAQKLAHIGSWEWDIEANEVSWSDELYRIFELTAKEFKASYEGFLDRLFPEDRDIADRAIKESLVSHEPFHYESRIVRPSGELRAIEAHGEVVLDTRGVPAKMLGTAQDITDRKRAEEELERVHAELEHRANDLQRSNLELEQFAWDASHDLGEPLRVMSQVAGRLAKEYGDRVDERGRDLIASIVDGAERAQMLISDLLEYSRVSRDPFERAWVDCEEAFREAVDLLAESIAEKNASVTADPLPTIEAHPVQLRQLLQNLLSNALKFAGDSPLRVHLGARREGNGWRFSLSDNGIGIDPQQADRVFELFRRLSPRDMHAGTGMGLSICKRIVERHGGRIWVEPARERGSVFNFTIPDQADAHIAALTRSGRAPTPRDPPASP